MSEEIGNGIGERWHISVDDHVVEPPTLWCDRLSKRDREVGPRVIQDTCETVNDYKDLSG